MRSSGARGSPGAGAAATGVSLEARALHRLGEHPGVPRLERGEEESHFCLQTDLGKLGALKDFVER